MGSWETLIIARCPCPNRKPLDVGMNCGKMAVSMSFAENGKQSHEHVWATRIDRARELQRQLPAAADLLRFYLTVLQFQRELARTPVREIVSGLVLREQIDVSLAVGRLPALLALIAESAPEILAAHAKALQKAGPERLHELFQHALSSPASVQGETDNFFARACLQPLAENLQSQLPRDPDYAAPLCPACGGFPQLSVLRPEGEGALRWLQCSFCLREWLFRRIVCPWCGEEDKEKLPYYSAQECPYVRVEACDSCRRYLKAVDLSVDGRAVPIVDEVALAVLDVWAADHGYTKIAQNLMGF